MSMLLIFNVCELEVQLNDLRSRYIPLYQYLVYLIGDSCGAGHFFKSLEQFSLPSNSINSTSPITYSSS